MTAPTKSCSTISRPVPRGAASIEPGFHASHARWIFRFALPGEVVLNCMASDGVRRGYDVAQLRAVRERCRVPLVASGGAGAAERFAEVFRVARVDAALAASVFHSGEIAIPTLRRELRARGIERSEEHTSELQSPDHLVCRLLLEKKKKKKRQYEMEC